MDEYSELLKRQHYICHIEKMKNVNSKKCQIMCQNKKIKNKASSNENFISEMH
jgi:hypothetical protein